MKINIKLVGFIAWFSYIIGSMVADLGEQNPAYTTDWKLVANGIFIMGLVFIWGYTSKD